MLQDVKYPGWFNFLLILLIPTTGMLLGVTVTVLRRTNLADNTNLVINLFFLAFRIYQGRVTSP